MIKTRPLVIGGSALAIPIAYLVKKHVDWMQTPEGKGRMLTQQLAFWLSWIPGVVLTHKAFRLKKTLPHRGLKQVLMVLGAGLMPVLGFSGGIELARWLYPSKKPPRPAHLVPFSEPTPWVPPAPLPPPQLSFPTLPPYRPYALSVPAGFGRVSGI